MNESEKLNLEELIEINQKIYDLALKIIRKENKFYGIKTRVFNTKTVGVQGDYRTYAYPAEIAFYDGSILVIDLDLAEKISTEITNNIKEVNRVSLLTAESE